MLFSGGLRLPGGGPRDWLGWGAPAPGERLRFRGSQPLLPVPGGGADPPITAPPGCTIWGSGCSFLRAPETSLRSRSLLYLAAGADCGCGSFGPATPIILPENGWISSTPTLNRRAVAAPGPRILIFAGAQGPRRGPGLADPLVNPYKNLTKGEMVRDCRNPELWADSLGRAFPAPGRWCPAGREVRPAPAATAIPA